MEKGIINGKDLIIEKNKKNILFKADAENLKGYRLKVCFEREDFIRMINQISDIAKELWGDIQPKEITCVRDDYTEYYDKKYDDNGYLTIDNYILKLEVSSLDAPYVYKFNKKRVETFIYDCIRLIKKGE